MSDVRSLLRKERALRRIDHPFAAYSATGTLECTVCRVPLKSDIEIWNKHLQSTQHAMRAERARLNQRLTTRESGQIPGPQETNVVGNKKRKASDEDEDSRKKVKPPSSAFGAEPGEPDKEVEVLQQPSDQVQRPLTSRNKPTSHASKHRSPPPTSSTNDQAIDEDEWAAFERDIAEPISGSPNPEDLLNAQVTISADPVLAADLAKQDEEEDPASRKERREAELEAEKEDAVRALEEEFDEMEGLEERVRKLREKREELRQRKDDESRKDNIADKGGGEIALATAENDVPDEGGTDEEDDFYQWSSRR